MQLISPNLFDTPPFPSPTNKGRYTFIDLFAGVGGFRLANQAQGGICVFSSEWNTAAQATYQANYGERPFGDITKEETKALIPQHFDLLCGGFPCQAFSIAGLRKGFTDTRGTLFFDIEQIIEKHRPRAVLLENVKNLVAHDKGKTIQTIYSILTEKLGYHVYYQVLNSMTHANIPQNRERIFIVAFDPIQVPTYREFTFPDPIPLTRTIHDILEQGKVAEKYYYPADHLYADKLSVVTNPDTVYQIRRVYIRENKSQVCPTLTANMGQGGHNVPIIRDAYGIRKLTPRECFAFQGYPVETFVLPPLADSKLYMQAGNSVTVPLVERICRRIADIISPPIDQ